jgi:hypothetical protein
MRRHGSESLWAQINRFKKRAEWRAALNVPPPPSWRKAAKKSYSLRWIVARCMAEELVGPVAAYRIVRNWTILHGYWPKPHPRPGRPYVKRPRQRKARVTLNGVLIDSKEPE